MESSLFYRTAGVPVVATSVDKIMTRLTSICKDAPFRIITSLSESKESDLDEN